MLHKNALVAAKLLNREQRPAFVEALNEEYQALREKEPSENGTEVPLAEAQKNKTEPLGLIIYSSYYECTDRRRLEKGAGTGV